MNMGFSGTPGSVSDGSPRARRAADTDASVGTRMTVDFLKKVVSTDPNSTPYSLDIHNRSIRHLENLSTLPKLRTLDVSFNSLADLTGLSDLPDLRELKAYSCKIQDCFSLGSWCPSLTTLLLSDNFMSRVPKSFRKLAHLRHLNMANNDMEILENLPSSLTYLDVGGNKLMGGGGGHAGGGDGLGLLVALETLLLGGNDIGPDLPKSICEWRRGREEEAAR